MRPDAPALVPRRSSSRVHTLLSLACGVTFLACSDDEARVNIGSDPLAVGAYLPFVVIDGCSGGGKINFCSTERLVSLDSYSVDDPEVAEIVPAAAVPTGVLGSSVTLALHGRSPGKTVLRASATFDDGSVRAATADLEVASVSRVAVDVSCETGAENERYLAPGQLTSFQIDLFEGNTRLAGQMERPIELQASGGTVERGLPSTIGHGFSWRTPPASAELQLRSPLDPSFIVKLEAYGPDRVTRIEAGHDWGEPPHLFSEVGGDVSFNVRARVGLQRPCSSRIPIVASTLSPTVCAGPAGETEWTGASPGRVSFTILAEGTCRLSVGAAGGNARTSIDLPFRRIHEATRWAIPGEPCTSIGENRCDFDRRAIVTCQPATDTTGDSGRWRETRGCGDLVCDYLPPGERGCADPVECIQCI